MTGNVVSLLPSTVGSDLVEDGDDAGSRIVALPVMHGADGFLLSLSCGLHPVTISDRSFHEFVFSVLIDWPDGDHLPMETQDRSIVTHYLPAGLRAPMLDAVLQSCAVLLADVEPRWIYRVTKHRNMPAKAMRKHDRITETMLSCGYGLLNEGLDPFARRFWILERL